MIHGLVMLLLLAAAPQTATFQVAGTVVREDQLDPAAAPQANQVRISGPATLIATIGAGGSFVFNNVRPGTYQLVVGPRITMPPMTLVVGDRNLTDVQVLVPLTADVAGTVEVEQNGPRPRFQLAFTRVEGGAPSAPSVPISATAAAAFTVSLPRGDYRIAATGLPAGYTLKSATAGGADVLGQPLKIGQGSPTALTVTLGVSSPPPWVKVSGRVTGGTAASIAMTGAAAGEALNAPVGPNGAFEFPMVLPGTYTARPLPVNALAPVLPVTVGNTDVANLELRLPAAKEVSGRITTRGSVAAPRVIFSLATGQAAAATPASISIIQGVVVNAAGGTVSVPSNAAPDGSFKILLPEGERTISIVPGSIPPGVSVESFTYGGVDLLKNPIRVALSDTAEIAITVDATTVKPHTVSGKVTGLLSTEGVRVVLQGGNLGTGMESSVAPDGSFSFSDILPGNYSARLSLSGHVIQAAVSVGNNDVTNLIINHPRLFSLGAHVLVEGDSVAPPAIPPVSLEARSATGALVRSTASSTGPSPMILTVSDGEHRISIPSMPAGYTLKSIRYGELDLLQAPLKVDGPITWEIVVRLVKAPN